MASFLLQVQGITQLTVGTTPTNDELSQFLVDGTKEVVNRIIAIRPDEIGKFTLSTHDSNDSGVTLTGQLLSVVREHDSTTILRSCSPLDPGDRYEATDSSSLKYRSQYNPGFFVLDGKVHTVPASAGGNNDAIVAQVYYAVNTGHSSSSIDNFPDEYEYLVVLYASMKVIQANIGAKTITSLAITTVPPDSPSLTTMTFSGAGDDAAATAVAGVGDLSEGTVTLPGAPTYTNNIAQVEAAFSDINTALDAEDVELAAARIQEAQIVMQNELNEFNEANVLYQAGIQKALADAQQDNAMIIQTMQKDLTIAQADAAATNAIEQANKAAELQNAVTDMQAIVNENNFKIQQYQAEVGVYSAEVATEVQDWQADLQAVQAEYAWLQDQYNRIRAEYDASFQALGSPRKPEEAEGARA